ncbi:hypothetical protein CHY08_14390 [Rhizobium leguminosarum bv. viciae]|uniref:hypothetical protein n=1 Tax=Rhizobium leguminosarum TaxID=384 RepID=UPI000B8C7760|nr:hypothetical protein [Rhizobium leguminosarum]ASR08189.1 hypothetical protein CHY08_14390 [Rhizobium leguminosarum bv. viciae]
MSLEHCKHDFKFENLARQELLGRLEVGDIFHAASDSGAVAICLVLDVNEAMIFSRRITTQHACRFDRTTGKAVPGDQFFKGTITSVEPLPSDVRNTFLEMDRQYRLGHRDEESVKLTTSQKNALLSSTIITLDIQSANHE